MWNTDCPASMPFGPVDKLEAAADFILVTFLNCNSKFISGIIFIRFKLVRKKQFFPALLLCYSSKGKDKNMQLHWPAEAVPWQLNNWTAAYVLLATIIVKIKAVKNQNKLQDLTKSCVDAICAIYWSFVFLWIHTFFNHFDRVRAVFSDRRADFRLSANQKNILRHGISAAAFM